MKTFARGSGVLLLLLILLPLHRLGRRGPPGSPAEHLRSLSDSYFQASWTGLLVLAGASVLLGLTPLPGLVRRGASRAWNAVTGLPPRLFALGAGGVAGLLTLVVSARAFALQPALVDATGQLIHARYLASGALAGPALRHPEFFTFQYMVNLPTGWSSQYPPGHLWALAAGFAAGAPWLVGPLLAFATVALCARLGETLLDDPAAARAGAAILAVSPFFLGHNATFMNHATAAALGVAALLAAALSAGAAPRSSALGWGLGAGAALGLLAATRPLGALAVGPILLLLLAGGAAPALLRPREVAARLAAATAGVLPPLLLAARHNALLFGHPARSGYEVAQGPGHNPGFHVDPWGHLYTPLEGLAQTSSSLVALGMDLLVTPASLLLVIALVLLLRPPARPAVGILLAWALLPVALHLFYWHHDLFLGPRLLHEFTPAWALLAGLALVEAGRWASRPRTPPARFDLSGVVVVALALGLGAALVLAPLRIQLYASQWGPDRRVPLPEPGEPALVFVHGDWSDRLAARLGGLGMRADSIRAALRNTPSCQVQEHLDALAAGSPLPPPLHFQPDPARGLEEVALPTGTRIVTAPGEVPTPACRREVISDRLGTLELPPLLWRGDLPGLEQGGPLFARDLGPALNGRLQALHPDRRAFLYARPGPGARPRLLPLEEGTALLWEGESGG